MFLNQPGKLSEIGWDGPERSKLWRYNQHYFDDLTAEGSDVRRSWHADLMADWVAKCPPGLGSGWEPYPVSLRIVNWIKWANEGAILDAALQHSLAVQTRWLVRRLEWHLLGNHLFANAKALIFAGAFFDGQEAETWLDKGLKIATRQLDEQFLPDGGHFELSPMYHALATEDILDLINVLAAPKLSGRSYIQALDVQLRALAPRLLSWLAAMCHPDGRIALFNDAAFGIAPNLDALRAYASRLGIQVMESSPGNVWMKDSGYARLSSEDAVLIADLARIGPDYLPGHAHADTLSFEFSLGQRRVFVDSGTSVYGIDAERLRQRGTSAHNTVQIAGENSSDVWSGFRVGRRARPVRPHVGERNGLQIASAGHDGYRHLPGAPLHEREWELSGNRLAITDRLTARVTDAQVRYHLHPDVRAEAHSAENGVLLLPDGRVVKWHAAGLQVRLEATTWHPEFGLSVPTRRLVADLKEGLVRFEFEWD